MPQSRDAHMADHAGRLIEYLHLVRDDVVLASEAIAAGGTRWQVAEHSLAASARRLATAWERSKSLVPALEACPPEGHALVAICDDVVALLGQLSGPFSFMAVVHALRRHFEQTPLDYLVVKLAATSNWFMTIQEATDHVNSYVADKKDRSTVWRWATSANGPLQSVGEGRNILVTRLSVHEHVRRLLEAEDEREEEQRG
jgi:hypothetical protein